ncbi:hypothetical protein Aperf_G00000027238 [Anoplocephala perfoliata]
MASGEKGVLERCSKRTLNYYQLSSEKYECEGGDRLAINTQTFNRCLTEALNRCDELEVQLLNFESWIDLPIVNTTDTSTNFDEVSDDAQHLVDIVQQVQSALLSAVSDPALKDALPGRQLMEAAKYEHLQRVAQSARPPVVTQNYQLQSEMVEIPSSMGSIPTPFISDDQSGLPVNDGPVPLGALNPTIPPPQHSFTPPNPQARRIYSDVPSPFNQQQAFAMSRTGSDPNLIHQQQFMQQQQQQQALSGMHMQGLPPHSSQNLNNPGSYGF